MKNRIFWIFVILTVIVFSLVGCEAAELFSLSDEIIISEAVSSSSSSLIVKNLDSPDWIELYNATDEDIDISGFTIERTDVKGASYTFKSGIIKANDYFVMLACDAESETDFEYPSVGFKLPKEGAGLVLKDARGNVLTKLSLPSLDSDISYAYHGGSYYYCLTATPGKENAGLLFKNASDMYDVDYTEDEIYINEANRSFVELYNSGERPVQLAYFTLSDNAGDMTKWRFPYYELKPDEYFTVSLDFTGEYFTSFSVSAQEGFIYLALNAKQHDALDLTSVGEGMSVGRNSDGEKVFFAEATRGEKNGNAYGALKTPEVMGEAAPVHINELMLENKNTLVDEDGDRSPWVEIYNSSNKSINLENYFLSDDSNDLLKWRLLKKELKPQEYFIIYLSGKDGEAHTSFRISDGEALILTDFSTFEYESVLFPDESRLDNVSYGKKDGKWLFFAKATPGKENITHGSESMENADKLDKTSPFISEVSASKAARSSTKDWIEIYNPTDSPYNLDGLFLSDDLASLQKYALSGSISPLSYEVFSVSTESGAFSVSQAGETIYLSDGSCILDTFETGALRLGVTSGRASGDFSGERVFFESPTKGSENAQPKKAQLNVPVFSRAGGIVDAPFSLELSGEGDIYYTLDGGTPDKSSTLYTEPISIAENTVVRAVCVKDGHISSDIISTTYLFEEKHTIPVICISSEKSDFNAIYAVEEWSYKKSDIVERECYVEYYEADGTLGTSFPAGFRVSGNSTRKYAQKSLNLYLRSGYGQTSVVYPFFEDYPITSFSSLTLRNAGQNYDGSRLVDAYAGVLFSRLNLDCAMSSFVAVYINGRYWGLYDLKENQNESCFAYQHGVDESRINVIRRNTFAIAGDNSQIKEVLEYAQSWNLANDEKYARFCEYVDADAWIDYIIARSYCGDGDIYNQKMWNTNDYEIKWRPVFFDCDFSFRSKTSNTLFQYFTGEGFTTPDGSKTNMYIPTALKKNASWCEKFVERYAEVMKFFPEYSLKLYDEMVDEIREEMKRHTARWGFMSYSSWENAVKEQRER